MLGKFGLLAAMLKGSAKKSFAEGFAEALLPKDMRKDRNCLEMVKKWPEVFQFEGSLLRIRLPRALGVLSMSQPGRFIASSDDPFILAHERAHARNSKLRIGLAAEAKTGRHYEELRADMVAVFGGHDMPKWMCLMPGAKSHPNGLRRWAIAQLWKALRDAGYTLADFEQPIEFDNP